MPALLMLPFVSRATTTVVGLVCWCWCCCLLGCRTATGLSSSPPIGSASSSTLDASKIRAISFDVTGTLLATREPVVKSYHDACLWARLPDPPTRDEMKEAFKIAFRERSLESPCFGGVEGISGRAWWKDTVKRVLYHAKKTGDREEGSDDNDDSNNNKSYDVYTEEQFQRYFRRVYQHFGSPAGYMVLEDAASLLSSIASAAATAPEEATIPVLGITSNTPTRHMESVLPMLDGLHDKFSWFACSQEVGHEKPAPEIFATALEQARFWLDDPDLPPDAVLHIGDSYACDYCGARAFGFQALLLDRSDHPTVTTYQDWLDAPDYPGKSLEDAEDHTISSLEEVATLLGLPPSP